MKVENFRGIKSLDVAFNGSSVRVSGRNGSGKTSVYNAYLWCLFNKSFDGTSMEVRPIDMETSVGSNFNYQHNLDTKVELVFDCDGTTISVARVEKENWSVPRGMSTPIYKGQTQERYINDVPYGVREFDEKLTSICDAGNWFMLSSIGAFMNLDNKKRRAVLESISGGINELEIAKDYPNVLLAFQQGKSILELKRQNKLTKDTSKKELDDIPARIDQQEKLRVEVDVATYTEVKETAERAKAALEKRLEAHLATRPGTESNALADELATVNASIAKLTDAATKKHMEINNVILKQYHDAQAECGRLNCVESTAKLYLERAKKDLEKAEKDLQYAADRWNKENAKKYVEGEIDTVCPTCHRELDAFQIQEIKNQAIEAFNKTKADNIARICQEGTEARAAKDKATEEIAKYTEEYEKARKDYDNAMALCTAKKVELDNVETVVSILSKSEEHNALVAKKADIERQMLEQASGARDAMRDWNERTTEIQILIKGEESAIRDAVNTLASVKTNERIDAERKILEDKQTELAQTIANCDMIDMEIQSFIKRKITLAESNVSKYFMMVSWQLYERNISNDGEKEICEAIIEGKPYTTQNTATKVNAGIDIINGISKALDILVPMFVDNKESVTEIYPTDTQMFTFSVVDGQELTIQ